MQAHKFFYQPKCDTHADSSAANEFLKQTFSRMEAAMYGAALKQKCRLVQQIVTTEVNQVFWRKNQPSTIYKLIDELPQDKPVSERLSILSQRLMTHKAMPVMTAHPTMLFSNPVLFNLHKVTKQISELHSFSSASAKDDIEKILHNFIHVSMLPEQSLIPEEEAERALFIYQEILATYPEFLASVAEYFVKVHGGDIADITLQLREPVMASFKDIYSWVRGDADGNHQVTAATMSKTVPAQQIAIIQVYIRSYEQLISRLEAQKHMEHARVLHERLAYLRRCITSIKKDVWFDVSVSQENQEIFAQELDKIGSDQAMSSELKNDIHELKNLIQLAGFAGGLKEFVRQSTTVNVAAFDNIVHILAAHHLEIQRFLQSETGELRSYHQLAEDEKLKIHRMLESNIDYFSTLRENQGALTEVTTKELRRLIFVANHRDIFPHYIHSDTKSHVDVRAVSVLLHLARYMELQLRIGNVRRHVLNPLVLCETPSDIQRIGDIVREMLRDPYIRKKAVEIGYFSYVGGPSDLGKTGGMLTHVELLFAQMTVKSILQEMSAIYPELNKVELRVLHGFGGDLKRRMGKHRQRHATFQGWDAYAGLGAPGAYAHFLHRVVGFSSESDYKVQELIMIGERHPKALAVLQVLTQSCIKQHESFFKNPETEALISALTNKNIERRVNTSSRAASKATNSKVTEARAIGFLNHFLLSGVHADVYMGMLGLKALSPAEISALPVLFNELTVVKDIVYKTMYAIATSQPDRARKKLNAASPVQKSLLATLDAWEADAWQVLTLLPNFLAEEHRQAATSYMNKQLPRLQHREVELSEVALGLMEMMGGDFVQLAKETKQHCFYYQQLANCITTYEAEPTPLHLENAALALRGVPHIVQGPPLIAELCSKLHEGNRKVQVAKAEAAPVPSLPKAKL
jgi:hypothetical protein